MTRSALAVPAALFAGLAAAVGCGPSVQSIHEGNVRFEHCYRLDLELDVATSHRQACWTTWLEHYTYGQSRDRLEYANRRVRAFASGDVDKPTLRVGGDPKLEESRQFYLVVPTPTNVHASPPPIATRMASPTSVPVESAPTAPSAPAALAKSAPGDDCSSACKSAFGSCSEACAGQAKGAACKSCDPDYKQCMQRCFE